MSSNLSSYLASRYLVADPKPSSKKRKRKPTSIEGLVITDDDDLTWNQPSILQHGNADDSPFTVSGATSEFRRTRKSNWRTLGSTVADEETATADAVLAATAAENESKQVNDDELPVVESESGVMKMSDGTHAGLQSAAAVSAQLQKRQQEERADFERHRKSKKEEETVYRDATGRRIDVSMQRAEARRVAAEAEEKDKQAKQALRGEVQLDQMRRRKEQLEDAKLLPFSRTVDDEIMNKELKDKDRWNDPMLQFMDERSRNARDRKGANKRPIYKGAAPPNRYGIKPGYRWDGVDRGIGFETERFKAINRRDRLKGLDYSWQMDE